jgi:HD-GYP domain-containing protein (c-di-GMP phosphodiesterase class II)
VERKIINAPFRINAKESAELNKHPGVGYEILQPIHHPYTDVPLAAKSHHERLDGRGYPDGLFDREIPYIAKIVSLADSFDAMTTDRPYKARRPMKEVVDDLKGNAGKQFAPELVTSFLSGLHKELIGEDKANVFAVCSAASIWKPKACAEKVQTTLNEMAPTTPMTYVSASAVGDIPVH